MTSSTSTNAVSSSRDKAELLEDDRWLDYLSLEGRRRNPKKKQKLEVVKQFKRKVDCI